MGVSDLQKPFEGTARSAADAAVQPACAAEKILGIECAVVIGVHEGPTVGVLHTVKFSISMGDLVESCKLR